MIGSLPHIVIRNTMYLWHGEEKHDFMSPHFRLIFQASGMISGGVKLSDGKWLYKNNGVLLDSRMLLTPPGSSYVGEFLPPSVEVVIVEFDCDELEFDEKHHLFNLTLDDGTLQQLQPSVPLKAHEVVRLRPTISTVHERFRHQPTSGGLQVAAALGLAGVLTWLFFLPDCPPCERDMSPAARLKAMIDKEPGWSVPMTEMFKQIGLSAQALRREFQKEFGMTPMAYRERKRRAIALSYIRDTRIPLKVVCERLGMKSPTHLSIYIRQATGRTPRDLRADAQAKRRRAFRA